MQTGYSRQLQRGNKHTATGIVSPVACLLLAVMMLLMGLLAGCGAVNGEGAGGMSADMAAHTRADEATSLIKYWHPVPHAPESQTDRLIAHGGGALEGYQTSNSVEAVMNAVDNGYSLIELDMSLSGDNQVVMAHDWGSTTINYYQQRFDKAPDRDDFLEMPCYSKYHTMCIENLISIFDAADSFKVVTDIKEQPLEALAIIAEDYPEHLDRFIVQIYDYNQLEPVKAMGYNEVILTLYEMEDRVQASEVYSFYCSQGLYAITISDEEYMDPVTEYLTARGVRVYRHPISNFEHMNELFNEGVYGIYTSSILPRELVGLGADYYITMPGEDGTEVKLTDYQIQGDTVADIVGLTVHGLKDRQYRIYYMGDGGVRLTDQGLDELPFGKIHMPMEIYELEVERFYGHYTGITIDYYLWKDENGVRLLDAKYEYRAANRKVIPNFDDTVRDSVVECATGYECYDMSVSDKDRLINRAIYMFKRAAQKTQLIRDTAAGKVQSGPLNGSLPKLVTGYGSEWWGSNQALRMRLDMNKILKRSFVAHAGDYYFYDKGEKGSFMQEDEFLYALGDSTGQTEVFVPVAETARALGAEAVSMDMESNIHILAAPQPEGTDIPYGTVTMSAGGLADYTAYREDYPYIPILQKTLVSAEYLGACLGRDYLIGSVDTSLITDTSGILIILPQGVRASAFTDAERRVLLEQAAYLY